MPSRSQSSRELRAPIESIRGGSQPNSQSAARPSAAEDSSYCTPTMCGLLWPTRNKTFVPDLEPRISIYVWRNVPLAVRTGLGRYFINNRFSNPASRSAQMPAAFLLHDLRSEASSKTGSSRTGRSGQMSVPGQIRKSDCATAMSAFPQIATKLRTSREVRFVPMGDIARLA